MRLFRLIALLGITAFWTGCGLPDSYFLQPPAVGVQAATATSASEFQITGTSRGSDTGATFQGYELYYKFYANNTDSVFNNDFTSFGTGSTYTDLVQAGFHRLCLGTSLYGLTADTTYGSASAPLVNIHTLDPSNIGNSYLIRIRFNDVTPVAPPAVLPTTPLYTGASLSYYLYTPPTGPPATAWEEVRRYVNMPNISGCKVFASNLVASSIFSSGDPTNYDTTSDQDLAGTAAAAYTAAYPSPPGSGYIIVMIYALSYGITVDLTPIYSSPVLLGYSGVQVSP
jgi:hypothetical protein